MNVAARQTALFCPWCGKETDQYLENGSHVICHVCCWEESSQLAIYLGIPFPLEKLPTGCDGDLLRSCIKMGQNHGHSLTCLLYTSPSPRDRTRSRMPSSA